MVFIKSVDAKTILDSRKEKTIFVSVNTNVGKFSSSAPNGKSKGKFEAKPYKKNLETDISALKKLGEYFKEESIEEFSDLRRIEDIVEGHVGANTLFALESAVLKAICQEQKKEIWQIINPNAKIIPRLVGNCIGGGKHSNTKEKKPDFQEFVLIPKTNSAKEGSKINTSSQNISETILLEEDSKFKKKKNDENAWITSLNEKQVLEILKKLKENKELEIGVDIAGSSFYRRKKYHYDNPMLERTIEEQNSYLENLIKNFNLFYIEDPFEENDFESFAKLRDKFPDKLIVGDDLTVTNFKRTKKAIEMKSINSLIVKPNQNGSLIDVQRICELAKKNNIKIVFSHRSGETQENILADLAFGFEADFFKCGISGNERVSKIKRMIEIEKSLEE